MPQFRVGRPPLAPLPSDADWHAIAITDLRCLQVSILIGLAVAVCVAAVWRTLAPDSLPLGSPSAGELCMVLLTLIAGHEALHMLGFPRVGGDRRTVIGVWAGSAYVQFQEPLRRGRMLVILLLPFLALSLVPFVIAANGIGPLPALSWISVANCVSAGSDMFIVYKLMTAIPPAALVLERGEFMYWTRRL